MSKAEYALLQDVIMDADFPDLDLALRRGRHIDRDDASWYSLLSDAQELLEPFYRRYGCELIHKTDGYFYLLPTGDKVSRKQLAATDMLVGQALALLYLDPAAVERGGVVTQEEVVGQLSAVLGSDALIGLFSPGKRKRQDERIAQRNVRQRVSEAVRRLANLGFVELNEAGAVRLRAALLRFAEPVRGLSEPAEALAKLVAQGEVALTPDAEVDADGEDADSDGEDTEPAQLLDAEEDATDADPTQKPDAQLNKRSPVQAATSDERDDAPIDDKARDTASEPQPATAAISGAVLDRQDARHDASDDRHDADAERQAASNERQAASGAGHAVGAGHGAGGERHFGGGERHDASDGRCDADGAVGELGGGRGFAYDDAVAALAEPAALRGDETGDGWGEASESGVVARPGADAEWDDAADSGERDDLSGGEAAADEAGADVPAPRAPTRRAPRAPDDDLDWADIVLPGQDAEDGS